MFSEPLRLMGDGGQQLASPLCWHLPPLGVTPQILQESPPCTLLGETRRASWAPGGPFCRDLSLSTLITALKQAAGVWTAGQGH